MRRWSAYWLAALTACGPQAPAATKGDETTSGPSTVTTGGSATQATSTSATSATSASTTSGEPTSTSTSATSGAETSTYIHDPDGGSDSECDVWAQDCPRGQKCQPWDNQGGTNWDAVICSSLYPYAVGLGELCEPIGTPYSGADTCDAATMCWGVDSMTNVGTCFARCGGTEANPICPDTFACYVANNGVIQLCVPRCDPLAPACADGSSCAYSTLHDFGCVPASLVALGYGSSCDGLIGCGDGLMCSDWSAIPDCVGGCCTTLCDAVSPQPCPDEAAGQTCIPLWDGATVGACTVPR